MALVYGQIESLKKIRETLNRKGISRFKSTGQLNKFIKNYEKEKEETFYRIEHEFELELDTLKRELLNKQISYNTLKTNVKAKLDERIGKLENTCENLRSNQAKNAFIELGNWYLLQLVLGIRFILKKCYNGLIWFKTSKTKKHLKEAEKRYNDKNSKKQSILSIRFAEAFKELEYTKYVINDINPLIAGAIGEHLVAKELKKLSDTFVVFNDFSLSFNPPIFNKKDNDRIHSIQIDHLLVTEAGIFIIETKNWSKDSIERLDLRSPIKQIRRTSYALFVFLNSNRSLASNVIKRHHWGKKELPIRSVIAMINHRPKEKFNHVAIKKLKELNQYINYFEPIFEPTEVKSISEFLKSLNN